MTATADSIDLGPLNSQDDMTVQLSTRPILRIWFGREKTEQVAGIVGFISFCKSLRMINNAVKNDDPYADYYFLQIERAIVDLEDDLSEISKQVEVLLSKFLNSSISLPAVSSKRPATMPVRVSSPLAFQMMFKLSTADNLVMKLHQANHIGILPNTEKEKYIRSIERRFRSVMYLTRKFRNTGVTRDDMAANNPVARKAIGEMGELEIHYLHGTTRSDFAPKLPEKRMSTIQSILNPAPSDSKKAPTKNPETPDTPPSTPSELEPEAPATGTKSSRNPVADSAQNSSDAKPSDTPKDVKTPPVDSESTTVGDTIDLPQSDAEVESKKKNISALKSRLATQQG